MCAPSRHRTQQAVLQERPVQEMPLQPWPWLWNLLSWQSQRMSTPRRRTRSLSPIQSQPCPSAGRQLCALGLHAPWTQLTQLVGRRRGELRLGGGSCLWQLFAGGQESLFCNRVRQLDTVHHRIGELEFIALARGTVAWVVEGVMQRCTARCIRPSRPPTSSFC